MEFYNKINKSIEYYLNDKVLNNAYFVNGLWGSGKTYYVNNILRDYLKENFDFKMIYISLYGVVSVEEIAKQIYSKLIFEQRIKEKQKKYFGKKKLASQYLKDTAVASAKNLVPMLLSKVYITLPKIDNYWKYITTQKIVLVFDDLERSRIDIVELMGYINNFVEEYQIKTIIVGNEKEIRNRFYTDGLIDKYNIVKDLKLPIKKDDNKNPYSSVGSLETSQDDKNDNGIISTNLVSLRKKVDYLFSSYEQYDKVKEKLFGYSYDFTPPIRNIFEELANKNRYILENLDYVENLYISNEHYNFRTFIFSLHTFNNLLDLIKADEISNFDEIMSCIVEAVFYCGLEMKNPKEDIDKNPFISFHSSQENIPQSVVEDIYVLGTELMNSFDLTDIEINDLIKDYDILVRDYKKEKENSLVELRTYWLDKSDEYIINAFSNAIDKLNSNDLNIQLYQTFLYDSFLYNNIFYDNPVDIDDLFKKMIKNIESSDKKIEKDFGFNSLSRSVNEDQKERLVSYCDRLDEKIHEHNLLLVDSTLNKILDGDNWSFSLYEHVKEGKNASKFTTNKNFMSQINVKKLSKLIVDGTSEDLSNILQTLKYVYAFSNINEYFKNDLKNLRELHSSLTIGLDKVESYILKYLLNDFIDYLNKIIEMIDQEIRK
ncbi:MAG: P-loop NTPase fold protein [Acholeplasmataceae bacterium]|nr:P-loop NTPase fold protein [Acholeplasmataceae bacterium]